MKRILIIIILVTATFPSITFASWAAIFTGKQAGETGIMGNEYFARDLNATNTTFEGLRGFPAGMITYSDGAFKVGCGYTGLQSLFNEACFYSKYIIPADWYNDTYKDNAVPRRTLLAKTVYEEVSPSITGYQVSSDNSIKCDASQYECRSVVIYNHYAKGADRWRTMSSRLKSVWDYVSGGLAYLMDSTPSGEAVDFINSYFSNKNPDGKRKRFPALFTVYFAGLDHEAHDKGMSVYKDFFTKTTDPEVKKVVDKLKDAGEFDNKIFILTADHGHTAMPTNLTYERTTEWVDIDGNIQTTVDYPPAEMSCKLKIKGFGKEEVQLPELANNNLHIWELGEVMRAVGKFTRGSFSYKVLAPQSIATLYSEEEYGAKSVLPDANVIAAFNGPMAHIYVTNLAETGKVADIFRLLMQSEYLSEAIQWFNITDKGYKDLRSVVGGMNLKSSIDKILVRVSGNYCVFDGLNADGSPRCATTDPFNSTEYVDAWTRINGMNHKDRSGDIVILMNDGMSDVNQRYTTGSACKSWHGSLNRSDSYVPFIVAYPGGNKFEFNSILNTVCPDNNCEGNWKLSDLIKEIVKNQYSGQ